MLTYIIIAVIAVILLTLCSIFFIRRKHFRPSPAKEQQQENLNNMIIDREHKPPCKTTPCTEKLCRECSKRHFEQMKSYGKEHD